LPLIPPKSGGPPLPAKWPSDRFDVVLRFDRAAGDASFAFQPLYPKLLSGDSDQPFGG
jgi:hypothetical protein